MHKFTTDELVSQKPSPEEFKKIKRNPISFILHNIRSLENVGLFFRLGDAILAEKVYLTGYTGYPDPQTSSKPFADSREPRVARHAEKEIGKTAINLVPLVPWQHHKNISEVLTTLKSQNTQIVGVEQTDISVDYRKAEYKLPLVLIFGHERTGVEEELLEKCDFVIHIPMLGYGNSHNVAMAGAIISSLLTSRLKTHG